MDEKIHALLKKSGGTLTGDEEKILFTYYNENRTKELRAMIAEKNLGLCMQAAAKFRIQGIPEEDLQQEAVFGLLRAVDLFDPERGIKFSTYAYQWIEQAIRRYISNNARDIRIPVHMQIKIYNILKVQQEYREEHMEEAPMEYLVEQTGMQSQEIKNALKAMKNANTVSLNARVSTKEGDDSEFGDFVEAPGAEFETDAEKGTDLHALYDLMDKILDDREKEIINLRFGLQGGRQWTLEEVGEKMGVTRERIRQSEQRALLKMRRPQSRLALRGMEGYLS